MVAALEQLLVRSLEAGIVPGAVGLLGGPDAEPVAVGAMALGCWLSTRRMRRAGVPSAAAVTFRGAAIGTALQAVLSTLSSWLLGLVVLLRLGAPDAADVPLLPARAPASEVEHAFSGMKPFTVQRNMGPSAGKDATCSIYSDGDLDTGARVTWAVTLCTVHSTGAGPAG